MEQDGWLNNPPHVPKKPDGLQVGVIGKEYSYTTVTVDPEGCPVYYNFSWGGNSSTGWLGPYNSQQLVNASHQWTIPGKYHVKVKAKDTRGYESGWSESLLVKILNVQTGLN
jgi:hypothetical protein